MDMPKIMVFCNVLICSVIISMWKDVLVWSRMFLCGIIPQKRLASSLEKGGVFLDNNIYLCERIEDYAFR